MENTKDRRKVIISTIVTFWKSLLVELICIIKQAIEFSRRPSVVKMMMSTNDQLWPESLIKGNQLQLRPTCHVSFYYLVHNSIQLVHLGGIHNTDLNVLHKFYHKSRDRDWNYLLNKKDPYQIQYLQQSKMQQRGIKVKLLAENIVVNTMIKHKPVVKSLISLL